MSSGVGVIVGTGVDVGLWFVPRVDELFDAGLTVGPGDGDTLASGPICQGGTSSAPGTPVCVPGSVVSEEKGMSPWKNPDIGDSTTAIP